MTTKYNPADVESIITYAKKLVKKSLRSFVDESKINEI